MSRFYDHHFRFESGCIFAEMQICDDGSLTQTGSHLHARAIRSGGQMKLTDRGI